MSWAEFNLFSGNRSTKKNLIKIFFGNFCSNIAQTFSCFAAVCFHIKNDVMKMRITLISSLDVSFFACTINLTMNLKHLNTQHRHSPGIGDYDITAHIYLEHLHNFVLLQSCLECVKVLFYDRNLYSSSEFDIAKELSDNLHIFLSPLNSVAVSLPTSTSIHALNMWGKRTP